MAERGLSLASHHAKALAEVGARWDYVITVCDEAYERCPDFPAKTSRLHWSIKDPSGMIGDAEDELEDFRRAREELSKRIEQWLSDRPECS
jgi:arsenate reductase